VRKNKESLSSNGYKRIHVSGHPRADRYGRVFEHIVVWEQEHNACLLLWGRIHHRNHVKTDNRPENLEAMMHRDHPRLHHLGVKRSPEVGMKISAKKKGVPQSLEANKKRSEKLKGRVFSLEHRRKIGEANKARGPRNRDTHGRYIRFCTL